MRLIPSVLASLLCLSLSTVALAAPQGTFGSVKSEQKISDSQGTFDGVLSNADSFGWSVARLGDLDGDGIVDLAVGALGDDDGGPPFQEAERGAVWILFLDANGTVKVEQKISDTQGGFTGVLDDDDRFGWAVEGLGDLDGDGVEDLAVGARFDDDAGTDTGAVWVLFLDTDGTVKSHQKIVNPAGSTDGFANSIASLGDLDGDGTGDIAVGTPTAVDGGASKGALWILFLNPNGTVKAQQRIASGTGGFGGVLTSLGAFGWSLDALDDLDGDGIRDLAVGAMHDSDGSVNRGAVWILLLNANGTVKAQQKISSLAGGLAGPLDTWDEFGSSVAALGDLDGDGLADLAVGAERDSDVGNEQGAVWVLFLNANGTVKSEVKINELVGGFGGALDFNDYFGCSLSALGDLDGDGVVDLATGAQGDDDRGGNRGAVWTLFLVGPDTEPPVLFCPTSVLATCPKSGSAGAAVIFSVTALDAIDPSPSVVCVPPSGSVFPRGTTMVNCTATDASGNQSVSSFPVTVWPTVRPR